MLVLQFGMRDEKKLLYLHPNAGTQNNDLVCLAKVTEVKSSQHEIRAFLERVIVSGIWQVDLANKMQKNNCKFK